MDWALSHPRSFRLNDGGLQASFNASSIPALDMSALQSGDESTMSISHLILLVFEAVMEVVCVSLPGYIIARCGYFDAEKQKFLANLNVMLFTPCLIFTKLASQLNADKLADLAIIPVIFLIQTTVSYLVSIGVSKVLGLKQRPTNFITAMAVFGNSNSLPISLVLSLSQTLNGLKWHKIPGDNNDEVGARGILYLMIFQQLGQLVRWSWGYHVLLKPKDKYPEYQVEVVEEGWYRDEPEPDPSLIPDLDGMSDSGRSSDTDVFDPSGQTPVAGSSARESLHDSEDEMDTAKKDANQKHATEVEPQLEQLPAPLGNPTGPDDIMSFPQLREREEPDTPSGVTGLVTRTKTRASKSFFVVKQRVARGGKRVFRSFPSPVQTILLFVGRRCYAFYNFLCEFMNPPLWAMICAILVASVPALQRLFFQEGSFVKNSVTSAVSSSAGVAVPLILVVLGANLARNTQKQDTMDKEEAQIGTKLLVASLLSRMVLPTVIMAPIIALFAKYVPVSILDDPIFVVVCFLLVGAPSALQLAQICQINEVYETVMGKILFQSYVIWILPSTLVLVMLALQVVDWAGL